MIIYEREIDMCIYRSIEKIFIEENNVSRCLDAPPTKQIHVHDSDVAIVVYTIKGPTMFSG